jgi:hypothetical protein
MYPGGSAAAAEEEEVEEVVVVEGVVETGELSVKRPEMCVP